MSERVYCIPAAPHLEHLEEMERLQAAMDDAAKSGDEDARVNYLVQLNDRAMEWNAFLQQHRKPRVD